MIPELALPDIERRPEGQLGRLVDLVSVRGGQRQHARMTDQQLAARARRHVGGGAQQGARPADEDDPEMVGAAAIELAAQQLHVGECCGVDEVGLHRVLAIVESAQLVSDLEGLLEAGLQVLQPLGEMGADPEVGPADVVEQREPALVEDGLQALVRAEQAVAQDRRQRGRVRLEEADEVALHLAQALGLLVPCEHGEPFGLPAVGPDLLLRLADEVENGVEPVMRSERHLAIHLLAVRRQDAADARRVEQQAIEDLVMPQADDGAPPGAAERVLELHDEAGQAARRVGVDVRLDLVRIEEDQDLRIRPLAQEFAVRKVGLGEIAQQRRLPVQPRARGGLLGRCFSHGRAPICVANG